MADYAESWEYSYVQVGANGAKKLVGVLNDLAAEGWSLVTVTDNDRTMGMNSLTALIRRPIDTLPEPELRGEGWYPDPAGRFDLRLWNGQAWTFNVARSEDKSTHRDPPTARRPTSDLTQ